MRSEQTKRLWYREFKRLFGVPRRTFNEMVKVLQDAASLKQTRGYPNKLGLSDQALICLQYWREYRTYFHIAGDWQVSESTICRIVHWVESTLWVESECCEAIAASIFSRTEFIHSASACSYSSSSLKANSSTSEELRYLPVCSLA